MTDVRKLERDVVVNVYVSLGNKIKNAANKNNEINKNSKVNKNKVNKKQQSKQKQRIHSIVYLRL